MKKDAKSMLGTAFVIAVIVVAILLYPWFVSVNEYGETVCSNIFGMVSRCD